MSLTATLSVEVDIELTGSYVRADPDVGLGAGVEDQAVVSAVVWRRVYNRETKSMGAQSFDLLAGLDAAALATIEANILEALGADAVTEALLEDAE